MEVLDAIKSVKSVSKYKPDPVPEQKVQAVVNAARFAVSADNIQPWKFIVVSDEDRKRKLAGACTNGRHMADAPPLPAKPPTAANAERRRCPTPRRVRGAASRSRAPSRPSCARSAIRSIRPPPWSA